MTWAQEIQRDLEEKAKKASAANDNMEKVQSAKKLQLSEIFQKQMFNFNFDLAHKREIFLLTLL